MSIPCSTPPAARTRTPRLRGERLATATGTRYWLDETCWADMAGLDDGMCDGDGALPERVVDVLVHHRVAVDHEERPALAGLRVGLVGSGPLALHLAHALAGAGPSVLALVADGVAEAAPPPALRGAERQPGRSPSGWARRLRPRHGVTVTALESLDDLPTHRLDVVVVATATVEPDRYLMAQLVDSDVAHLVVRAHRETAGIGPLVLPGLTGCMQCHDRALAGLDGSWPQALAQLCTRRARPRETLARYAAATVVLELGWLARDMAAARRLAGRCTYRDLDFPDDREFTFAPDPGCRCGSLVRQPAPPRRWDRPPGAGACADGRGAACAR